MANHQQNGDKHQSCQNEAFVLRDNPHGIATVAKSQIDRDRAGERGSNEIEEEEGREWRAHGAADEEGRGSQTGNESGKKGSLRAVSLKKPAGTLDTVFTERRMKRQNVQNSVSIPFSHHINDGITEQDAGHPVGDHHPERAVDFADQVAGHNEGDFFRNRQPHTAQHKRGKNAEVRSMLKNRYELIKPGSQLRSPFPDQRISLESRPTRERSRQ